MNFDNKAPIYEQISISQKQAADTLFSMLEIQPTDKIIDMGCGTGYLTELLFNKALNTQGIDISKEMIQEAKKLRPTVNFAVADAENFISVNTFDLITTNAVTYYFKNLKNTFRNFYGNLKHNGLFALQAQTKITPQFTQALNELLNDNITRPLYSEYELPINHLDEHQFSQLLNEVGFKIEISKTINFQTEYTPEEALLIFKSGTATPLLDQAGYKQPLTSEYVNKFWEIIAASLKNQATDGKVILDVPRCFIIARKI